MSRVTKEYIEGLQKQADARRKLKGWSMQDDFLVTIRSQAERIAKLEERLSGVEAYKWHLDEWWKSAQKRMAELEDFKKFGARQMQNQLGWEPNTPIGRQFYVTRPIPHGDPVYRRVDPEVSPLMKECLDHAEEKAREHQAKYYHPGPIPPGALTWDEAEKWDPWTDKAAEESQQAWRAWAAQESGQESADNASERIRKYIQGKVNKYAVGVDMATSPEEKGESSFDFVERKVKVVCPRCGDRPWPTSKPFDETDLNCPACGSRELERIG